MEKSDFVELAPVYYALGIAVALLRTGGGYSTLKQLSHTLDISVLPLFEKEPLAKKATRLLQKAGVVDVMEDDFGPTLYSATDALTPWVNSSTHMPFVKFQASGESVAWIVEALEALNIQYTQYYFDDGELEGPDDEARWEPLPLDRSDPLLVSAQEALEAAIDQIEADNGYAVHATGERSYVLSSLKAFGSRLRRTHK